MPAAMLRARARLGQGLAGRPLPAEEVVPQRAVRPTSKPPRDYLALLAQQNELLERHSALLEQQIQLLVPIAESLVRLTEATPDEPGPNEQEPEQEPQTEPDVPAPTPPTEEPHEAPIEVVDPPADPSSI